MEHRERRNSEVEWWQHVYRPLNFSLYAIAPGSKAYYKNLDVWTCFKLGGNIAIDTIKSNKIALDVDAGLSPLMRKVANRTLSFKSPKGYGIILDGPIPEPSYSVIRALKLNNRGDWKVLKEMEGDVKLSEALKVGRFLRGLGLKDATAIHSSFEDTDGLTYMLLPPSETCRWQGYKSTVLGHSTCLPICNQSPNGRHDFRARTFIHYTIDLLDWDDFCKIVGLKI
jgi:hypothetical protein